MSDLPNLLLSNEKVIEQPFVRGRDGALLTNGLLSVSIRVEDDPAVLAKPAGEVPAASWSGCDTLCGGEAFSMLLEVLDAEELAANQLVRVWREHHGWSPECPVFHLSGACAGGHILPLYSRVE